MGARPHDDEAGATREGTLSLGVPGLVGGRDAREWTPDDLQIAGLVPMSTVDWPGKFAVSLFLQGCPWACPYCHNSAIIDPRSRALSRGARSRICWRAGEASSTASCFPAARRPARSRSGRRWLACASSALAWACTPRAPYPRRLSDLLGAGLVDWVGIDVKATRGNYEAVAGRSGAGERAWESLGIVLAHPEVDHEVRLTVYPDGPGDGFEVAARAREMGVRTFALQQARDMDARRLFRH